MTDVRMQSGGDGDPVLLLLHGLGATGDVWSGLRDLSRTRWPGRWVAPDLPGHGGSPRLSRYSFGHLAAAVAGTVSSANRVVVLGHSLGGVVALALASGWFGVRISAACGLGIKVAWTDEELARARALAARGNPVYATRREAAERHLKLAGLTGLVTPEAVPEAALVHGDDGWTVAFDPAAFAIGAPDMPGLLAASRAPVILAAGERDSMCRRDQLQELVSDPVILPGLGHNAHVESPDAVWPLLERLREAKAGLR
ncbi:MAG TPA: alpha/beta hydrolase [Methylomirabilota bacterium]